MSASIVSSDGRRVVIQFELNISSSRDFVDQEQAIQEALNEAGTLATAEVLRLSDTEGQPIDREGRRFTSKGQIPKRYETPYGPIDVARHVYQHSGGGATRCPLDERAGIVLSATPRFARIIASKYAEFGSSRVQEDMAANHGRHFSRGYVSNLAEAVAAIAESQSDKSIFRLPELPAPTATLVVAVDQIDVSTFRPMPAPVAIGSIGFHDDRGQRQHVIYLADLFESEPSSDQSEPYPGRFVSRMEAELKRARGVLAPECSIVGISGGHPWSTRFLHDRAAVQFIDPERVVELLAETARAFFERASAAEGAEEDPHELAARRREMKRWIRDARDRILSPDELASLIAELGEWIRAVPDPAGRETIARVEAFLARERDSGRMNYRHPQSALVFANADILADSARVIFGDRIGHPKFKIGLSAARAIVMLRELTRTPGRWDAFWEGVTRKRGKGPRTDSG
jgi:hypothetical protein